jgi:hypothetical protein
MVDCDPGCLLITVAHVPGTGAERSYSSSGSRKLRGLGKALTLVILSGCPNGLGGLA